MKGNSKIIQTTFFFIHQVESLQEIIQLPDIMKVFKLSVDTYPEGDYMQLMMDADVMFV